MKKNVKIILLAAVLVLGGAGGAVALLSPPQVEAAAVTAGTATLTFTEQGVYDYAQRYVVYPLVSGEVLEVHVEEGDAVSVGDVLATVSASDYEYQIEQLGSAIAGYNAQIAGVNQQDQQRQDELAATLEELKGQMTTLLAEKEKNASNEESLAQQIKIQERIIQHNRRAVDAALYDFRNSWEYGEAVVGSSEYYTLYTNALTALTQSELVLEQLMAGNTPVDVYEGQLQSLQAQIDAVNEQMGKTYTSGTKQYYSAQIQAAQSNIAQMQQKSGQAEILATADGVISDLPVKNANVASQSQNVATIGAGGRVEVFIPIREIDGVRVGDKVELILDKRLGKETVSGTVFEIDNQAQSRLSALGVEERGLQVLVQPDERLTIGFDMDVRFTVYTVEDAIVVPKTAVFTVADADYIWVVRDELLVKREIGKGIETRDGYIVDEGLEAGELVVTDADNADLKEGKKVKTE